MGMKLCEQSMTIIGLLTVTFAMRWQLLTLKSCHSLIFYTVILKLNVFNRDSLSNVDGIPLLEVLTFSDFDRLREEKHKHVAVKV